MKIFLVRLAILVKTQRIMKRIYALIVMLGFVLGALVTGCNEQPKPADTGAAATNAPAAPPASTNK
jgi:hypothetical protein